MKEYDVVIIGSGLAYVAAEMLRNAGLKVCIVEKDKDNLGGVCLNKGCVPTKLYLQEAKTIYLAKHSRVGNFNINVDIRRLLESKRELVSKLRDDITKLLKGVDILYGYGELLEPYTVKVGEDVLKAKHVIINTGKSQQRPEEGFITTDELLEIDYLPSSVSLVGDDPILYEFACMFSLFGSQVNIYTDEDLDFMHPSIKGRFQKMLKGLGVNVGKMESFKPSEVNVSVRRRKPNSECVKVDVERDEKGHILVDSNYETSLKDHYAVGDVNGVAELAHASRMQALSVAKKIIEGKSLYTPAHKIPYVLYTIPMSYARVGLTKKDLKEKTTPLRPFAVGHIHRSEEGLIILYLDKKDFLVGAEVFCARGEEVISVLTSMLYSELNLDFIKKIPLPHPTMGEVVNIRL